VGGAGGALGATASYGPFCSFPLLALASGRAWRGGSVPPAAHDWGPWAEPWLPPGKAETGGVQPGGLLASVPNRAEHPQLPCTESGCKSPVAYRLFLGFCAFHLF